MLCNMRGIDMKNICRPFTLYSDFLPPTGERRDCQYLSLGYYDGLDVGDNLFADGKWDFGCLWDFSGKQKEKLNGSYSEQTIFGFRGEEDDSYNKDTDFWEQASGGFEYPFLFLVMLQDQNHGEDLTALWERKDDLEKALEIPGIQRAITYLTLDTSDLLLILSCKVYETGARMIDSFHRRQEESVLAKKGWQLRYSFTIPSVSKAAVNSEGICFEQAGKLEKVYIYVIEREPGSIITLSNKIENVLKKQEPGSRYYRESVPGCNDEVLVMGNVSWKFFLSLYKDKEGILNHSSVPYQDYIFGVTTILGNSFPLSGNWQQSRQGINGEKEPDKTGKDHKTVTLSSRLRKECMELFPVGMDNKDSKLKKGLLSVINSLEKFENGPFEDYIFISALKPMKMLIDVLKTTKDKQWPERYTYSYRFLEEFILYAQNTVRSDRQFTQTPDFTVRIFDMPAKINAFYNAYINEVKKVLNHFAGQCKEGQVEAGNHHEYEFLICPGIVDNMKVDEVFPMFTENRRLFLVDMPEKQVFNPELMLVMLGHEISHFVGSPLRNRELRYEQMAAVLAHVFTGYLECELEKELGKAHFEGITGKDFHQNMESEIKRCLLEYQKLEQEDKYNSRRFLAATKEEVDWWKERIRNYGCHSRLAEPLLAEHMSDLCRDGAGGLQYLKSMEYIYQLNCGCDNDDAERKSSVLHDMLQERFRDFNLVSQWSKSSINAEYTIKKIMYLFKECFADLSGILVMRLSAREYLRGVMQSAHDQGCCLEELIRSEFFQQGALVCYSMILKEENLTLEFGWTLKELSGLAEGEDNEVKLLAASILNAIYAYFGEADDEVRGTQNDNGGILYNKETMVLISKYLFRCRCMFERNLNSEQKDMQQKVHKMFSVFHEKNIEKVVIGMQHYIDEYRKEINAELRV